MRRGDVLVAWGWLAVAAASVDLGPVSAAVVFGFVLFAPGAFLAQGLHLDDAVERMVTSVACSIGTGILATVSFGYLGLERPPLVLAAVASAMTAGAATRRWRHRRAARCQEAGSAPVTTLPVPAPGPAAAVRESA